MSEGNDLPQDFKDFISKNKIDFESLEAREQDQFDIERRRIQQLQESRMKAFPYSINEVKHMNNEVNANGMHAVFDACFGM